MKQKGKFITVADIYQIQFKKGKKFGESKMS